jgi:hypothetical protein
MEYLLPKEQLKGLTEEEQKSVKDEALNQFLLGSIFGGGGIATGYQAVQNIIPNLQKTKQQQGLLQELTGIQNEFFPTQAQLGERAFRANAPIAADEYGFSIPLAGQAEAARQPPIDFNAAYSRLGRLATNPNATAMIPSLSSAFQNLQPKVQGDLVLDPNMQVQRGLPTMKDGVVSQYNPLTRGYASAPSEFYKESKILATPPEISVNTELVPQPGGGFRQREVPGSTQAVTSLKAAEAIGLASGQVEKVVGADGTVYYAPRSSLLTQPPTARQPGSVIGTGGVMGGVAEVSPAQRTMNETADARYKAFSKISQDSSETAGGRKLAAQQLYDLSTRIDNNKLTGLQAGVYSYMNAIPGVGKLFEQDITDVTRMNQAIATAQLEKTAQQKGSASNLDAQVIARGYATLTDPASATRMLAAQEVALADKDIVRNQFVENYKGDPAKIGTAWSNSQENQPIFNHPKFKQFLNEQVNANPSAPVLPAGFTLVQGKSGKYGIKNPDGTVTTLGQ